VSADEDINNRKTVEEIFENDKNQDPSKKGSPGQIGYNTSALSNEKNQRSIEISPPGTNPGSLPGTAKAGSSEVD
jgi:hypothetical protein